MDPTCTRQERMKPIFFCYWDLSQYKKWRNKRKRNFTSLAAIWKWRYIGSPSQFSDGGIDFSCWDKSQWQNKIAFVRSWLVYVEYIASIEPIVQLMWFLLVSKAAILNLELTKSHRDFSV